MSRAENSERGELLLEVKRRSLYFGRWSRVIDIAGGLSLVLGAFFLSEAGRWTKKGSFYPCWRLLRA